MKNPVLVFAVLAASTSLAAVPNVDQNAVTVAQDSQSRLVTVGYTLTGEPAVITVDFQTNAVANAETGWTSIGEANFTNTTGYVNQVVPEGEHSIYWQPKQTWPDQVIDAGKFRAVVKAWATNAPPDYCVACLLTDEQIVQTKGADWDIPRRRYFVSAEAVPGGVTNDMYKTEFLVLRKIPASGVVWRMGPNNNTWSAGSPTCKVMLTQDYYMGIYEFTKSQYGLVKGTADSGTVPMANFSVWSNVRGSPADYPWPSVGEGYTNFTHDVASDSALGGLRSRTGIDSFDLPTEAQWEYACRAGNGWFWYNQTSYVDIVTQLDENLLKSIAWYSGNSGGAIKSVGGKQPNAWGLYDMLGNALELTLNWAGGYYPTPDSENGFVIDPKGPVEERVDAKKIWRGASGSIDIVWVLMGVRMGDHRNLMSEFGGFRVVCDAVAK